MAKLVVFENLTLDGVMQSPGRYDEDCRDGFQHGGWAMGYDDAVKGKAVAEGMATAGPLLFGRRTYEDFYNVWPKRKDGNPFTEVLNNAQKYVASTTLSEPLPWMNSTLLEGDVPTAVARLKEQPGKDIVVLGSGELVKSLIAHNLVDVYSLNIYPVVLGSGRRLFADTGVFGKLRLVKSVTTTTGVIMANYEPAGAQETKR